MTSNENLAVLRRVGEVLVELELIDALTAKIAKATAEREGAVERLLETMGWTRATNAEAPSYCWWHERTDHDEPTTASQALCETRTALEVVGFRTTRSESAD